MRFNAAVFTCGWILLGLAASWPFLAPRLYGVDAGNVGVGTALIAVFGLAMVAGGALALIRRW